MHLLHFFSLWASWNGSCGGTGNWSAMAEQWPLPFVAGVQMLSCPALSALVWVIFKFVLVFQGACAISQHGLSKFSPCLSSSSVRKSKQHTMQFGGYAELKKGKQPTVPTLKVRTAFKFHLRLDTVNILISPLLNAVCFSFWVNKICSNGPLRYFRTPLDPLPLHAGKCRKVP